jgi:hypothetical protein
MADLEKSCAAQAFERVRGAEARIFDTATRLPYSHCDSWQGLNSPSRTGIVSWSESKDGATAVRRPCG